MGRSFRKTPIMGRYSGSDKISKQYAHRCERCNVRATLRTDPQREVLPHPKVFGDIESFNKDGKQWINPTDWPRGHSQVTPSTSCHGKITRRFLFGYLFPRFHVTWPVGDTLLPPTIMRATSCLGCAPRGRSNISRVAAEPPGGSTLLR